MYLVEIRRAYMKDFYEKISSNKVISVVFWILVVIIGIIVISPLIDKITSKIYKSSLENEEIDFEDMGPEIILVNKGEEV